MLFQVTLVATLLALPQLAPVDLTPQIEADDDEDAKKKLASWLEKTGYAVAPGSEPQFKALDDSGLPPEVAAINTLADENADLKAKLAALNGGELQAQVDDLKAKLAASELSRTNALASLDSANALVQAEAQKVADRDSQIATLSAQLQEALAKASPAASPTTPADGSTPAPQP